MENLNQRKILICDSNLFFTASLSFCLKNGGWDVEVLTDFSSVDKALDQRILCIFLNLSNKIQDPFSMIEKLKKSSSTNIPLIGYCGHKELQLINKARELGCDHIVTNREITSDPIEVLKSLGVNL